MSLLVKASHIVLNLKIGGNIVLDLCHQLLFLEDSNHGVTQTRSIETNGHSISMA